MIDKTQILFDKKGGLKISLFDESVKALFDKTQAFLMEIDRTMFLPLDLLTSLIDDNESELAKAIARTDFSINPKDVSKRLKALSKEIEEDGADPEENLGLHMSCFSKGFIQILFEASKLAGSSELISRQDIVKTLLWRIESTESASVRWAVRRLGEGGGDLLFDKSGIFRESICTPTMWKMMNLSMEMARKRGTPFLGTPHLIATFCAIPQTIIWRAAESRGLSPNLLKDELLRLIGVAIPEIPKFLISRKTLTPRMVRMLSHAYRLSEKISEEHVIKTFLEDGGSSLELLQALGLESEIRRSLGDPKVLQVAIPQDVAIKFGQRDSTPTLDMLGRDLTEEALNGKLPDIVGRERELKRIINVLLRKEQRNPLLTGEAGVGKTALAVALAKRIASGKVPDSLKGYRVVEINGASLMSGTSYRGDLESRIKGLLNEASKNVILFIDEAHAVFSPKSGSQSPAEIPNYFKSALASGEIAVVGATTESEYRRWIEQDPALKRRFEKIDIDEPSIDLVRHILGRLAISLEEDYKVSVSKEAIEASIQFSIRFLPEQRLPDKAKKLLMDACIACSNDLTEIESNDSKDEVKVLHVAEQIVYKTGLPFERVVQGQVDWWVGLERRINDKVIGQELAAKTIAKTLIRTRLRRKESRPMGTFLFLGPAGVGKNGVAKLLADIIYGDKRAFFRLDMADFHEVHSISRLIGAPPGYVGYEDEDLFVTPLRRRPGSVVLLDDFDKAHPTVQERILRVVEEGQIRDTRGYSADVTNALFVFSVQSQRAQSAYIGFGEKRDSRNLELKLESHLERLGEIVDSVVTFGALDSEDAILRLLHSHIEDFVQAMKEEYEILVSIDEQTQSKLEQKAKKVVGAKAIEDLVDRFLLEPTTEVLLGSEKTKSIKLVWSNNSVVATAKRVNE